MEDEPFHQPKHHHTLPSKTKTYAEVVKQHNLQEGKGVQGITSGEAITDDKIEPIVIQTEKSKTKWLDKVWVGHLKNEGMFDRVEEELQEMQGLGGTKVKSAYWGEDMVILHDLDEVTVNIINQRELVTGATPFSSIQKWTPMMVPSYRLTWLLIWGVPLQAWDAEYIADIVATCGELVELDPATEDKSRMNIARVLIRTKGKPLIAQKLSVIVDGCRHSLEVREDTVSGWGRKRRLKPNEGLFSSPFSTDMEDEDDEPNTYDHRWISPDGLTVSNVGASPTQRPSFGKRIHRRGRRDSGSCSRRRNDVRGSTADVSPRRSSTPPRVTKVLNQARLDQTEGNGPLPTGMHDFGRSDPRFPCPTQSQILLWKLQLQGLC